MNKIYSPFFNTLYDETQPIGDLGRGTHYSIIEVAQWKDLDQSPCNTAHKQRIAVIWDEDHDQRIIKLLEKAYFEGTLSPVCIVGERKGHLTILTKPLFSLKSASNKNVYDQLIKLGDFCEGDYWSTDVECVFNQNDVSIINDKKDKVKAYLDNIALLWDLY